MATLPRKQKAALVTGGARRVGQAIALRLAAEGYAVALHYNLSYHDAEATAQLIRKRGGTCKIFAADLERDPAVLCLIRNVFEEFPGLSLLVNNASIFFEGGLTNSSVALFDKHYHVNVRAPYLLMQEFSRLCSQGAIVNILDRDITKNKISYLSYLLSKKTLAELTALAAMELAPSIRVNAVAPGAVLPPEGRTRAYLKTIAQNIPLKKTPQLDDVAQAVVYLAQNPSVTGQTIFVDGGEHLS